MASDPPGKTRRRYTGEHLADIKRRIQAALIVTGVESIETLARLIDRPGLGRDTLYNIGSSRRPFLDDHELQAIADALDLPVEFFLVDFAALRGLGSNDPQLDRMEKLLRALNHGQDGALDILQNIKDAVADLSAQDGEPSARPAPAPHQPGRDSQRAGEGRG